MIRVKSRPPLRNRQKFRKYYFSLKLAPGLDETYYCQTISLQFNSPRNIFLFLNDVADLKPLLVVSFYISLPFIYKCFIGTERSGSR